MFKLTETLEWQKFDALCAFIPVYNDGDKYCMYIATYMYSDIM